MVKLFVIAAFAAFMAGQMDAQIQLHVDPTANTFWFSGSDTGFAYSNGDAMMGYDNSIGWASSPAGGGLVTNLSVASAFTVNVSSWNAMIEILGSGRATLSFNSYGISAITDELTIVADSSKVFSFSSFSTNLIGTSFETIFETVGPTEWALQYGTGFAGLSSSVPEPSEWAGAAGLGVLVLAVARKRRKVK